MKRAISNKSAFSNVSRDRTSAAAFFWIGLSGLSGLMSTLYAQSLSPEPEVRRALPVTESSYPTPTPIPVMRALPVDHNSIAPSLSVSPSTSPSSSTTTAPLTSIPRGSRSFNSSILESQPTAPAPPPPSSPSASASSSKTPSPAPTTTTIISSDAPGSIRLTPGAAVDPSALATSQLAIADGCYARKQPELAIPEYEKFLIMASRSSDDRERALYRLGESQRQMGSMNAAENTFLKVIAEYPAGQYVASSSYRLGEMREARSEYSNAADNFATTAKRATDPSIRLAALYHQALSLEKSGHQKEGEVLFRTVASEKQLGTGPNPYRTPTLMHLATLATNSGNKQEALADYREIMVTETKGETFAQAALNAAQIESDLGHPEEARKLLEKVASSKDSGRWQSIASLGALRLAAQSGDNGAVLRTSESALAIDSENKPEILLLQANALRKLGKNGKALENYDIIIREYTVSKAASEAPFQRLLALHALRSPQLLSEIDQYLLTASAPSDRARAQLLKAEATLMATKYQEAAQLYHDLPLKDLPPTAKSDIFYKEAWALMQANTQTTADQSKPVDSALQAEALGALTRFIDYFPDDTRTPASLAQRGLLNLKQKKFDASVADFTLLETRYPKAPERELALQQKGLLLGQQQKSEEMVATFTRLIQDYPKSSAAPEAHYWIGLTALDRKDYPTAIAELTEARKKDPKQFGERAGLRILLARYDQNDVGEASREAMALKSSLIPPEVGRWLGLKTMEAGDPSKAERFLAPLVNAGLPGNTDSEIQGSLAQSLILQNKLKEAQIPAAACLKLAKDPAARAKALLMAAAIQRSLKDFNSASSMVEEVMLLQPEGPINAEARILSGDLLVSKQDYVGAAKAYITVAVLYDDATMTPKALARAADAYRQAGNEPEAQKTLDELHKRFPNFRNNPGPSKK